MTRSIQERISTLFNQGELNLQLSGIAENKYPPIRGYRDNELRFAQPFDFNQLKQGKFIIDNFNVGDDRRFSRPGSRYDTEEQHEARKKVFGPEWKYYNKEVVYNLNTDRYRTKEFKDIDWQHSIVLFGCSIVFGQGIAEDETISHHLSQVMGVPVINMGIIGSSIEHAVYNNSVLRQHFPTPKAVINLWSSIDRCMLFSNERMLKIGRWNNHLTKLNNVDQLYNYMIHAYLQVQIARSMWKDITKYVDWSLYGMTTELLDMPPSIKFVDQARDGIHPGSETCYRVAQYFAQQLQQQ